MLHRLTILAFILAPQAFAGILSTAESFFDPAKAPRMGIEVEFQNLEISKAAEILQKRLGGVISSKDVKIETTVKETLPDGKLVYNYVDGKEFYVKGSDAGDFVLKHEINLIDDQNILFSSHSTVEVVGPPQRYEQVVLFHEAVRDFQKMGARGTDAQTAVSIQVNAEFFQGQKAKAELKPVLSLLRNYLHPKNREALDRELQVPEIRRLYLKDYSPGFYKKLFDPSYEPSWQQFYDDFFLRQSAEFLEIPGAWDLPIEEVQGALLKSKNPIVPAVVKQNRLRISSLLLWLFPDQPYSQALIASGWAKPVPIVEFREGNNDFDVLKNVRRSVGIMEMSQQLGVVDHEEFLKTIPKPSCSDFYSKTLN